MPTLIDFRRRIRSIKNTQQITRAMKFVAAAKLRRAQERALSARPYARQMQRVLGSALSRVQNPAHPLMARRPEERILVLVVSGDKGLCGAFNTNVLRRAQEFLREHAEKELSVVPIGKKGRDALRKRKIKVIGEYINFSSRVEFSLAQEIAGRVNQMFSNAEVDAVYGVYNEFKSVLAQRLMVERLLPVDASMLESEPAESGVAVDYIYEQPAEEIFARLLPRYVETQVYRMMMESAAAEHAARMTAMDSATSNAAELMDQLTLHMNKVRQAAITKEIIEVVSGAASAGA